MKITCQACSAKYTIADDKVRGRKVKIRCKGCGTPIVVDGQKSDSGEGLVGTPSMSESPPAGAAPAEAIPPPPQVPSTGDVWNVNLSDTDSRTMTAEEIIAGWASGVVTSDAFVWKDGMADWVAILDCTEIASRLGTPAAAAPTGTPYGPPVVLAAQPAPQAAAAAPAAAGFPPLDAKAPAGAARLAGGRSNTADLFGGVERAGSEQEVVSSSHSLPTAPGSTAYGDDKMTGARNENSVLFSLDSLKAGFAGGPAPAPSPGKAAPKAPSARSAQTSNPDDPFGMGGTGIAMASPGGNALFSLADNNALLTAPAPPEPPPVVAVSHDLGGGSIAPSPAQKRKQMILIGGIVAGVLIMGIVLGLALGGDKEEAKNEGASSAQVGSDLVKDKAEEKKEEPKPEEKKEEPKPEEKKEESKPEEKTADAKSDTSKKSGSVSGASAKKEEKKEEPKPGPATDAPFSKASAISALSAAAAQASGCKKPGGPTGAGKVQVTFAPSGRVTTANIAGPPFAGTAVGGCIAGAFRRAKVPPFAGNPVTVQKSFSVN